MILDEQYAFRLINKINYPFLFISVLCGFTCFALIITKLISSNFELLWIIGGTELLLYLILNAISSLVVINYSNYIKKTLVAYLLNFIVLTGLIYLLTGFTLDGFNTVSSLYTALIFCFITSLGLITLLRSIIGFLKD